MTEGDYMCKKGVTLIELVIAVAVLGLALIPMLGGLSTYFGRTTTLSGELNYSHRAQNILNDILSEVSYAQMQKLLEDNGAPVVNVADVKQRDSVDIKDLTTILKRDGTALCPLTTVPLGTDTPNGEWQLDAAKGTFFEYKGKKYYFTMRLTNIPLQFHWQEYTLNNARNTVTGKSIVTKGVPGTPDVQTIDKNGNKRDMFMKIELFIDWQEYNKQFKYSFVTFKANLEDAND